MMFLANFGKLGTNWIRPARGAPEKDRDWSWQEWQTSSTAASAEQKLGFRVEGFRGLGFGV